MAARDENLGYWCAAAVAAYPERIAILDLCGSSPRDVTYGDLERRLNRAANLFTDAGLVPGDRLAMIVDNRTEFIEIMFGAMRTGVVPVPLSTRLGADTLRYILDDASCRAIVIEPESNAIAATVADEAGIEIRIALDEAPGAGWQQYETAMGRQPDRYSPPDLTADHPCFQPYTSGSTGRPKGVVLTHAGQLWWIRCVQKYWPSSPETRALTAVPLYHKNAMAGSIKPLLLAGGSVVLLPDFEPRRFLEVLSSYRCTRASAVPTVFTRLLQQRDLIETLDFPALESLGLGSAPVQKVLMENVKKAFGCRVSESYGLTEGGPVMIGPPLDGRETPFGSCGVAWPEGEVKLTSPDGKADPHYGELWVRNPGVTPGYHNLPEVNASRIRDGWLATGDLFSVDEGGFFYFRGRVDDMFNCGGENIYPKEVENLLIAHPDIYDASVVAVSQPVKGYVPVAMAMRLKGADVTEQELRQYCLDNGPAYAHPRRIRIVDELPLNAAAKVDRTAIKRILDEAYADELAAAV